MGMRPKIPYWASAGKAPDKYVGSCAKLIIPSSGAFCNGEDINKDILEGGAQLGLILKKGRVEDFT